MQKRDGIYRKAKKAFLFFRNALEMLEYLYNIHSK
jgi:hypothetical protein